MTTHWPAVQVWSAGHFAPWQSSTHVPELQKVPAGQPAGHEVSTHVPELESQESGVLQEMPPHVPQPGMQTPSVQASPAGHETPWQRSAQAFPTHDCPWGQTTPLHGVPH